MPFLIFRVIVSIRSGKLSFRDLKSPGIQLQKTCRKRVDRLVVCFTAHDVMLHAFIDCEHSVCYENCTVSQTIRTPITFSNN